MKSITLNRPDDWHLHLRDGDILAAVAGHTAATFKRAIIMPNLVPPVTTVEMARLYRQRIMSNVDPSDEFEPQMTLYLTDDTSPEEVRSGARGNEIKAVKLYPAGATTNSQSGVTDIELVMPTLEAMADVGLPLLVHGEVTDPTIDVFDREAVFIDRVLEPLNRRLPELRIVLEHVTTKDGVQFVTSKENNIAATITAHHLILNRNHLLVGGIRPHYYCLPIVKREEHRRALVEASTSGDPRFFFGSDSAPHTRWNKECACGCAGVYSAPVALSVLAEVFELHSALDRLNAFSSLSGCAFYGLPPNTENVTLRKKDNPLTILQSIPIGDDSIEVFDPGIPLHWALENARGSGGEIRSSA